MYKGAAQIEKASAVKLDQVRSSLQKMLRVPASIASNACHFVHFKE